MKTHLTSPDRNALHRIARCITLAALALTAGVMNAAEKISDSAHSQIAALMAEKEGRTPAQRKMDSRLVYFVRQYQRGVAVDAAPNLTADVYANTDNRVLVDVSATVSPALRNFITQSGGLIVSDVPAFEAMRVLMPAEMIESLAARNDVRFVQPAVEATTDVGSKLSEAVRTHRADTARTTLGVDGTGIKIGVLSDGVNSLAASKANGNINANASALAGQAGSGDEGTAMMELIQDIVPGAQLIFGTASTSAASFASNILALQAAGCTVIVDDVGYSDESPFQDMVIAQAVQSVSNLGVMYFVSARNAGNKNDGTSGTWEGDFADGGALTIGGKTGRVHDFGGGVLSNIVTAGGSQYRVDFFWADPRGASSNDYDLFVTDASGNVLRSSTNLQTGTQDPYESVSTLNVGERIVILQEPGAAARFLHLDTGRGRLTVNTEGRTRGHHACAAANAFGVAATNVANSPVGPFTGGATNPVETFSSDGPRRFFFQANGTAITPGNFSSTGGQILNKPDITAADGSSTSVPGFGAFFGTSAAAPNAAAIAAMIRNYKPSLTPAQVRTLMTSTALDIEAVGLDRDSGAGIVMALPALQATTAPDVLTIAQTGLDASGPNGGPFSPTSGTYTLTNTSGSPVNWTAASTQSWNTLTPASGTLAAGNSVVVTCAINSTSAASLAGGNYIDTVTITNTGSGFSRQLSVNLVITTPGANQTLTVLPNNGGTSVNARAPITSFNFERAVYLISAAEMAANGFTTGNSPNAIGWSYSTAPGLAGSAPLTIYLQNTADTTNTKSTTWTTAIGGMTTVHSATTTLPNVTGTFDITLSGGSPFTYTGGGLYVAFDWGQYTGTLSTTAVVSCNSSLTNGLLGAQSTTSAPTTIAASNFRPETRLTTPFVSAPAVTTPTSASITTTSATLGGNVTNAWGSAITARGVVYAKTSDNSNPKIGGASVTVVNDAANTTGVFAENISGLTPGTGYSFAAFATNGLGTTYTSPVSTLTTVPPAPTVTAITPNGGPIAGGQNVTITGTNFTGATGVTIGGTAATGVIVVNAATITATTPAHAAGAASVVVTTPGGSNSTNTLYTYFAVPTVTAITPNSGAIAGGQGVTITGTNFTGATSVTIGGTAATGVIVVNATTITATTPAHASGTFSVVVTTPGGSNSFNLLYTYLTPQESWRLQFFGITTNTGNAADTADPDGDGNDNRFEFAAGLIPTDPNSRFKVRVEKVVGQPTQRAIIFSPLVLTAGRTYVVKFKVNLTDATWLSLTSSSTADVGNERNVTDLAAGTGPKFYHVEVTLP